MKLGIVFPQTEIGTDSAAIRDFAQAAEGMGYDYLLAYDHVLGADARNRPGWLAYRLEDMFHEVFVLFGYLAGCTKRIGLATGVLILPQRQTALAAKQAAEVDVLCGGRLRLGVGLGWNSVEYEALGTDFRNRGARISEQIEVLRALWTQEVVTFRGRWHTIVEAGISPLPVQRPIPIWMGGASEAALARAARVADGWILGGSARDPYSRLPAKDKEEVVEFLRGEARKAGRDPQVFGIEARTYAHTGNPGEWKRLFDEWRALGATHFNFGTMNAGLGTPDAHVAKAREFLEAVRS